MNAVEIVRSKFVEAKVINDEVGSLKGTYVYLLIADNEVTVLGEGAGRRGIVIFPGYTPPAHIKMFTAAMSTLTSEKVERVIIPTQSKEESKRIEKELKRIFNFHSVSIDERNLELLDRRCRQIGREIPKEYKVALFPLIMATGSDAGTFKKMVPYLEDLYPGFRHFVNKFFGGYYKPY